MIRVTQLHKTFGPVVAVDQVSFQVSPGTILGFLGPNGAGKSTTLRVIAGFLAPTAGEVWVGGINVADPRADFRSTLGYLPESAPSYREMRVRAYLRFVAQLHRVATVKQAVERVIERVGLGPMAGRRIATLSKGYRQRVGLAQALVHDPPVVVLDEPTSGLDPNQIVEIREVIKALKADKTVVFSSHRLSEVEAIADRVLVLNHGRVVADATLSELTADQGSHVHAVVETTDTAAVSDALASLGHVRTEVLDSQVHVYVQGERDLRAAVAAQLTAQWPLVHLSAQGSDLATLFRDLTT